MDIGNESLYYHWLANADSYWGKIFYEVINRKHERISGVDYAYETNHEAKSGGVNEFKKILRARKKLQSKELRKNEELRANRYLSLPFYLQWLFHPTVVSIITVPVCVIMLYLPLHLIKTQTAVTERYFKSSKPFIITEKFLEEALIRSTVPDTMPPAAPRGLRMTSE